MRQGLCLRSFSMSVMRSELVRFAARADLFKSSASGLNTELVRLSYCIALLLVLLTGCAGHGGEGSASPDRENRVMVDIYREARLKHRTLIEIVDGVYMRTEYIGSNDDPQQTSRTGKCDWAAMAPLVAAIGDSAELMHPARPHQPEWMIGIGLKGAPIQVYVTSVDQAPPAARALVEHVLRVCE